MRYEDAVKIWGARRLEQDQYHWNCSHRQGVEVNPLTVDVRFVFEEGYACCGGSDPNCYCSFAESPSAEVEINGACAKCGRGLRTSIDASDFNFVSVLGEIVDAGNGVVTSE